MNLQSLNQIRITLEKETGLEIQILALG
jgi:hypothetical protein